MTKEEAIEYNKNLREYMRITDKDSEYKFLKENYEALDMAIEALEQDPILDTRQRERQLEIEYQHGYDKGWEEGRKALEQQPCDDCISRESIIEWLKDKDIIKTKNQEENARRELAELPSVTPSYNSIKTELDCISREAVQDLIAKLLSDYLHDEDREKIENVNAEIGELPSVQPQRKRGKWIEHGHGTYECSECGYTFIADDLDDDNFCSCCGTKMNKEEIS